MIVPDPVWRLECQLGEGPLWLAERGELAFVDIKRGHLHLLGVATGERRTRDLGGMPSFVVAEEGGALLVGSGSEVLRLGEATREVAAVVPQPAHNRTNDATVDHRGRLWFGTMDDAETQPSGAIWCLDRGRLHHAGGGAVVTNGPAVSRDGLLYHVDSGARRIWRHRLGAEPGLGPGELFLELRADEGFPDGITLDAEDCLWVGLWDGWAVRRYAPDGRLLAHIRLPCARVTKLAFGGADLATAYVTTARVGLDEAALARQPLAGSLFAFKAPVAGTITPKVARR
ncbi:MAG: SMP-30/gluconolactonase/LRE family protein [Sphingomonadales bacterium]|nr:SMP-30/gluconolactonase/LRE family protein [Sphingomonadales bacterium]